MTPPPNALDLEALIERWRTRSASLRDNQNPIGMVTCGLVEECADELEPIVRSLAEARGKAKAAGPDALKAARYYFHEGSCSAYAQFNGEYCRDTADWTRWCIHCAGLRLLEYVTAAESRAIYEIGAMNEILHASEAKATGLEQDLATARKDAQTMSDAIGELQRTNAGWVYHRDQIAEMVGGVAKERNNAYAKTAQFAQELDVANAAAAEWCDRLAAEKVNVERYHELVGQLRTQLTTAQDQVAELLQSVSARTSERDQARDVIWLLETQLIESQKPVAEGKELATTLSAQLATATAERDHLRDCIVRQMETIERKNVVQDDLDRRLATATAREAAMRSALEHARNELAEFALWMECDLTGNGEGPSGGFKRRALRAHQAHDATHNALAALDASPDSETRT